MTPSMRRIRGAIVCTVLTFISGGVYADDDNSFFGKDFAVAPGEDDVKPAGAPKPTISANAAKLSPTPLSADDALRDRVRQIASQARSAENQVLTPAADRQSRPTGKQTIEITEVAAVLDGANEDSLRAFATDMITVVDGKRSTFSLVYVLGEKRLPFKLEYEIAMRGGRISYVEELPEKYRSIAQAPAWILAGKNQEIVIEGAGKLSENLSAEGAIITRATEKVTLAAAGSARPEPRQP